MADSYETPSPSETAAVDEIQRFHEIARKHYPLPAGVSKIDFRFGENWAGEDSIWIVLTARDELKPSDEYITGILRFAENVRSDILKIESDRWPYIKIETK